MLAVATLSAATVTPAEARRQAVSFLAAKGGAMARGVSSTAAIDVLSETKSVSPYLYVYNISTDKGFVIVSGDDRTEAILGYSDHGTFDAATLPDNTRAWLEAYAEAIAALEETAEGNAGATFKAGMEPVRPLLTTQWGQKWPYNRLCPNNSATGCVATAMAQVMKYYEWPQEATSTIPAYDNYKELPPMTFDWNLMESGYGDNETVQSRVAVAQLMLYCGHSVCMNYGATSSASHQLVPEAMHRYLGYDGGAYCAQRSEYTFAAWDELLHGELAAGRPVIYFGQRSGGAHEFVCDGYDGQGFYHINWGWDGLSDGWFRLTILNPKKPGTGSGSGLDGYTMYQSAVIGLQPERGGTSPDVPSLLTCEEMRVVTATRTERDDLSGTFQLRICRPMVNYSRDTLTMGYGLALMRDEVLVEGSEMLQTAQTFVPGSYINRSIGWEYAFGDGLTGSYRIVPVCSIKKGKATEVQPAIGADSRYITVELTETTLTYAEHPRRALVIDDVQFCLKDGIIDAIATVTNHGDNYDGQLHLYVCGVRVAYLGVHIPAGATEEVTFRYKRSWTVQDYKIGYSTDDTEWLAEGSANYTTANTAGTFAVWYADGRSERVPIVDNQAVVPKTAVAVEFDTSVPAAVVPNDNPNCLYYASSSIEAMEAFANVVKDNYIRELTLTDGYDFYCPMAFTAGHVVYTRTFEKGYDGNGGGWDTIILPFDVETVTTDDGRQIDWFRSPQDMGKDFWLMAIGTGTASSLAFTHTDGIKANRPYLIAVPGTFYGNRSLQGSSITFAADHTVIHETALTADNAAAYTFAGSYAFSAMPPIGTVSSAVQPQSFQLNAIGSSFIRSLGCTAPFRVSLRAR